MYGVIAVELVVAAVLFGAVWFLTLRRTKGKAGTGKSVVLAYVAAKFKHDYEQGELL